MDENNATPVERIDEASILLYRAIALNDLLFELACNKGDESWMSKELNQFNYT